MKSFNAPLALLMLTLCLVGVGLIFVYSASASSKVLLHQLEFAGLGLAGMMACYLADYRFFKKISLWLMLLSLLLCGLVFRFPAWGGAHRWIIHGNYQFQPSELAKLALVIYMAKMLSDRRQYIKSFFSGVMPALIVTGIFALVIVIEPDLGGAFVLCVVIFGMWLAAEMRWFHLIGLCVATIPAGVLAFLAEPWRIRRLIAFLHPDPDSLLKAGFQLNQSLIAAGSGGLTGLGLGASHQKVGFLNEPYSDFIFAIIGEETGLVGTSLVLLLYTMLTFLGWRVAMRTTDLFSSLLASGITLMFFISAAINMGVVLGLLPTKGLVLPFISAGGSSLIVSMMAMGILMNIARNQYAQQTTGPDPD